MHVDKFYKCALTCALARRIGRRFALTNAPGRYIIMRPHAGACAHALTVLRMPTCTYTRAAESAPSRQVAPYRAWCARSLSFIYFLFFYSIFSVKQRFLFVYFFQFCFFGIVFFRFRSKGLRKPLWKGLVLRNLNNNNSRYVSHNEFDLIWINTCLKLFLTFLTYKSFSFRKISNVLLLVSATQLTARHNSGSVVGLLLLLNFSLVFGK